MDKKNKIFFGIMLIGLGLLGTLAFAAPVGTTLRSILPEQDSKFYLGTTTPSTIAWLGIVTDEVCLTGDVCRTTWPTGGSGTYSFTPTIIGGTEHSASSTRPFYFSQGLLTASTTVGNGVFGTLTATSSITFNGVTGTAWTDFCTTITGGAGLCDGTDATGGGTNQEPFPVSTIGGTLHASSSTLPFYMGIGLLTSSSTVGTLTVGTINSTSTANFLNGLTITCTGCITDTNIASTIARDSELHSAVTLAGVPNYLTLSGQEITLTKLDISDDTNATGGLGLTLTANDFACDTASASVFGCLTSADWTIFNNKAGFGYLFPLNATTTQLTFSGGVVITCTGCLTDVNVADIALGGGTSGNYVRTIADSGNSTITVANSGAEDADVTLNVIDVNCTNCLGATEIDETFNWTGTLDGYNATQLIEFTPETKGGTIHSASSSNPFYFGRGLLAASSTLGHLTVGTINATSTATFSVAPIFSSLTGILKGNGASALTVAADGTDFSLITALTCTGTDKFSAVTADGTFTCTTDSTAAGAGTYPFTPKYNNLFSATSTTMLFENGLISYGSSTFMGKLNVGNFNATSTLSVGTTTFSTASAAFIQATSTEDTALTIMGIGESPTGDLLRFVNAVPGAYDTVLRIYESSGLPYIQAGYSGNTPLDLNIFGAQGTAANPTGGGVYVTGGRGVASGGNGGGTFISSGYGTGSGNAGSIVLEGAEGGSSDGNGGTVFLNGGPAIGGNGNGGTVYIHPGKGFGNGNAGYIVFNNPDTWTGIGLTGFSSSTPWGLLSVEIKKGITNNNRPAFVVSGNGTSTPSLLVHANGMVGIGTTSPSYEFSVNGNSLFGGNATTTGLLYSQSAGTSTFEGGIKAKDLQATANINTVGLTVTGTLSLPASSVTNAMLANSTITFGNGTCTTGSGSTALGGTGTVSVTSNCTDATTLDSVDSLSFLRSDASDNYTSGTLTFNSGTALTLAAGSTFTYSGSATSTWASAGLSVGGGGLASSAGLTITGGALRLNSESFIDLTGTGLDNTAGVLTPNCATITGSAALCDGDDATGGGASFGFPFTMLTNFGTTTFATSTSLWLRGGALFASTTATSTFEGLLQGGKQTLVQFAATANEPPATTYATFDTRNNHAVLDFDDTLNEIAYFTGTMPQVYSGRAVSVVIKYAATSATTNTVQWDISFERLLVGTDNLDTNSFGATSTATVTVPGTAGVIGMASINVTAGTNMDGIVAGDLFRLNVTRNGAGDSATGDAELISVIIKEE